MKHYFYPFKDAYYPETDDFIYQCDGCERHRAEIASLFLKLSNVDVLPWPVQSPDLNPKEKAWSIIKNRLRGQHTYPCNLDGLFKELEKTWNELLSIYFTTLVRSMMTRYDAVAKVKEKSTKYWTM